MKQGKNLRMGFVIRTTLACLAVAVWSGSAIAQGGGGAGAGGGGGAAGGGGGAGMAAAGTGLAFGAGTTTTTTTKAGSYAPQKSFIQPYYSSPMSAGWGANAPLRSQTGLTFNTEGAASSSILVTKNGAFGVPLYTPTTTAKGGAAAGAAKGGAKGGAKGTGATTAVATTMSAGFSTTGTQRVTPYVTRLDRDMVAASPTVQVQAPQMQSKIGNAMTFSPALQGGNGRINVVVDPSQGVVLQGTVATERDKRLAEGLARTQPGVYNVRNELVITGPPK